jgi:hypothetical protein
VFASDHAQYSENIRLPNETRSTTFETVARSLIHRHVVTGFVKKHCREQSAKGSPGYTDFKRLHEAPALARPNQSAICLRQNHSCSSAILKVQNWRPENEFQQAPVSCL